MCIQMDGSEKPEKWWRVWFTYLVYISDRKHMWDGDSDTPLFQRAKNYIYVSYFDSTCALMQLCSKVYIEEREGHYVRLHIYGCVVSAFMQRGCVESCHLFTHWHVMALLRTDALSFFCSCLQEKDGVTLVAQGDRRHLLFFLPPWYLNV